MDTTTNNIEPVTLSEVLELASWDRPRTLNELRGFVARRESVISDFDDDL